MKDEIIESKTYVLKKDIEQVTLEIPENLEQIVMCKDENNNDLDAYVIENKIYINNEFKKKFTLFYTVKKSEIYETLKSIVG